MLSIFNLLDYFVIIHKMTKLEGGRGEEGGGGSIAYLSIRQGVHTFGHMITPGHNKNMCACDELPIPLY